MLFSRIGAVVGVSALLGLAVGFIAGRQTSPPGADIVEDKTEAMDNANNHHASKEISCGASSRNQGNAGSAQDRISELEIQVAAQLAAIQSYEDALFGKPFPWPKEGLPEYLQREGFRRAVEAAMEDCDDELVRVDCEEFPCLAFLRSNVNEISRCPGWDEQFGGGGTAYTRSVGCGAGRSEEMRMMVPPGYTDHIEDVGEGFDSDSWKRMIFRADSIKDNWKCSDEG